MLRFLVCGAAGALLAAALPSTAAAATPTILPAVTRTVSAGAAVPRACDRAPQAGRGLAATTYTAPMSGYVTARLRAASGDWDLLLRDGANGGRISASQGFRTREVTGAWVRAGDRLVAVGCRRAGRSRTATISFTLADVASPKVDGVPQLVRVYGDPRKLEGLDQLSGFDVTEGRRANYADVIVDGAPQLATLRRLGLRFDVRIADLQNAYTTARQADARYGARVSGQSPLPSGRTDYRTYTDIQDELKKLAADHPDTVRPLVIGTSFQGREIQGLEIARDVSANDGRPVFFLMALHHAREWPSAEAAMEFAHLLTESSDPRIGAILDRARVVIVPLVNPDGYISSRGAFDPGDSLADQDGNATLVEAVAPPGGLFAYRRKNCDGAVPDGSMPCELQWGVDPNRNYGNLWGGNGSSQDPGSQSYHGPGPRSEPEVQAVWNYVRTHQVSNLITLHNVAALVLRPPGLHDGGKAPDEQRMKELGDAMANATGYTSEFGFQLYDTAGTTEDDTYAATGGYGYTIEIGPEGGNFHMPYETGVVSEWTGDNPAGKNRGGLREALLLGAEAAANPADHAQLTGTAPPGRVLRLTRSFDTKTSDYCARGPDPVIGSDNLPDFAHCPEGVQPAQTLQDKLDSTTTVPASGVYDWHINQSTRPFVGGGSLKETLATTPYREPTTAPAGEHVLRFDVTPQDATNAVRVTLDAALPGEDYDLYVYRVNADGTRGTQVGSSASPNGDEQVDLPTPEAGTYEAEVENFTAISDQFTLSEAPYEIKREITTGHPEAYTLTCEDGQGNVLETHSLIIDRGQTVDMGIGCGAGPTVLPAAGSGPTPVVDGKPVASGSKARKKAKKRKPSAREQRARCRAKATRIKSRAKRRAAVRRCQAAYKKATKKSERGRR